MLVGRCYWADATWQTGTLNPQRPPHPQEKEREEMRAKIQAAKKEHANKPAVDNSPQVCVSPLVRAPACLLPLLLRLLHR
jgi:hypothetical protein